MEQKLFLYGVAWTIAVAIGAFAFDPKYRKQLLLTCAVFASLLWWLECYPAFTDPKRGPDLTPMEAWPILKDEISRKQARP